MCWAQETKGADKKCKAALTVPKHGPGNSTKRLHPLTCVLSHHCQGPPVKLLSYKHLRGHKGQAKFRAATGFKKRSTGHSTTLERPSEQPKASTAPRESAPLNVPNAPTAGSPLSQTRSPGRQHLWHDAAQVTSRFTEKLRKSRPPSPGGQHLRHDAAQVIKGPIGQHPLVGLQGQPATGPWVGLHPGAGAGSIGPVKGGLRCVLVRVPWEEQAWPLYMDSVFMCCICTPPAPSIGPMMAGRPAMPIKPHTLLTHALRASAWLLPSLTRRACGQRWLPPAPGPSAPPATPGGSCAAQHAQHDKVGLPSS